ncbi:helix-turn-helix transcriptional regulator [Deinococcus multiflagellatus]|uniref:helix-turn-helix transcriptional regulator n=1 Tax=Deinococcus multiflagellatus TaxID=1656887 RepID=UPI001CCC7C40|nr:YafY family protein [Deinococcus multiflagellatus]MBZ9713458.1 YafY family transcriptional regulator [Deinococcus multiflagellatus]
MYDPAMRVLTVLELLQGRESVTGAELARRLEVSPRTVQRYVTRLQDLGIPVEGRRGVGGAYRLRPGFRLPPLMLTPEEALAAALGLRALQGLGLGALAPAAESAGAKLTRCLPQALRDDVRALEGSVQLDASPWAVGVEVEVLATLLRAVRAARTVHLTYAAHEAPPSERQVDVYRLVHFDSRWYAVGWCHLRGQKRSFRVDRMQALTVLDATFTPPADFDAAAYLRSQLRAPPTAFDISVWLDAPPEHLRGRVSLWGSELEPEGQGTRLRCQREHLHSFAAFLLGLDCDFRIDSPPELHAEFVRLHARCAAYIGPRA